MKAMKASFTKFHKLIQSKWPLLSPNVGLVTNNHLKGSLNHPKKSHKELPGSCLFCPKRPEKNYHSWLFRSFCHVSVSSFLVYCVSYKSKSYQHSHVKIPKKNNLLILGAKKKGFPKSSQNQKYRDPISSTFCPSYNNSPNL